MIFYHLLWTLAVLVAAPLLMLGRKGRLGKRLFPELPSNGPRRGCLWVHALSVGEVLSAVHLVRELRRDYPQKDLVLTVTTAQGMAVARHELQGDVEWILPMPLDFWWAYGRLYRLLAPSVLIIVETDIWPGLIHKLRKKGVPSVVVNGRVSPSTHRGYRRMGPLAGVFLSGPTLWLMQSRLDRQRLLDAGADPARVVVSGNIKFDKEWVPLEEPEKNAILKALGLGGKDLLWVAGSTHPGEEEVLFRVFRSLLKSHKQLRLVVAPRRIERAGEVAALAESFGLKAAFRSGEDDADKQGAQVIVLDTLGELGRIYGLSRIAFVGGSLVPVGGHNLLEPAWFENPVFFGPHMENFRAMSESILEAGGGVRVRDAGELEEVMERFLARPSEAQRMGELAGEFVLSNQGALARVKESIGGLISHGA